MGKYLSSKYASLEAYTPGEQPKDQKYVKLNTNESPYAPSEKVSLAAAQAAQKLCLYSDPECTALVEKGAEIFSVEKNQILFTNGSDEILNFAFMAFCDETHQAAFPDISYGFYPVFARLNGVPYTEVPLKEDFSIDYKDYCGINKTIFIANPNAPTGLTLSLFEIEEILKSNPNNVVVIDEAYVDFGAESAVGLIEKYDNLLVTGTFSKSRSLAGGRLGFGIACKDLIADLITIKYSTNPYNINSMTAAAGTAVLSENDYYMNNCKKIIETRAYTTKKLEELDFTVLPSKANFVFAKSSRAGGEEMYLKLKEKGVLVRHFGKEKIKDWLRITIGTKEQMDILFSKIKEIYEGV